MIILGHLGDSQFGIDGEGNPRKYDIFSFLAIFYVSLQHRPLLNNSKEINDQYHSKCEFFKACPVPGNMEVGALQPHKYILMQARGTQGGRAKNNIFLGKMTAAICGVILHFKATERFVRQIALT